jgi:catechol 2,3-dioxygenase-like lactoylglutathione lyase family enzyme
MSEETSVLHVALQYSDKKKADIFFTKILELNIIKSFIISEQLSNEIFGLKKEVRVIVYANKKISFEIFITDKKTNYLYEHICIEIISKDMFIKRCNKYGVKPIYVKKEDRTLLFIRDFEGNLFEIKEKK